MKRFRISFLAIIAVLAIGLTAATKADVVESKKVISHPNCYDDLIALNSTCTGTVALTETPAVACLSIAKPLEGEGVQQLNVGFATIECDDVQTVFCCADLTVDTAPCATNQSPISFRDAADNTDKVAFAKIRFVYCKEGE